MILPISTIAIGTGIAFAAREIYRRCTSVEKKTSPALSQCINSSLSDKYIVTQTSITYRGITVNVGNITLPKDIIDALLNNYLSNTRDIINLLSTCKLLNGCRPSLILINLNQDSDTFNNTINELLSNNSSNQNDFGYILNEANFGGKNAIRSLRNCHTILSHPQFSKIAKINFYGQSTQKATELLQFIYNQTSLRNSLRHIFIKNLSKKFLIPQFPNLQSLSCQTLDRSTAGYFLQEKLKKPINISIQGIISDWALERHETLDLEHYTTIINQPTKSRDDFIIRIPNPYPNNKKDGLRYPCITVYNDFKITVQPDYTATQWFYNNLGQPNDSYITFLKIGNTSTS